MRFTLGRTYFPRTDSFGLDSNLSFDDDDDPVLIGIVEREFKDVGAAFNAQFEIQAELYALIDEKYLDEKYEPEMAFFNHSSSGYNQFVSDLNEREIERLAEVFSDLIIERVTYIQEQYAKENEGRVSLHLKRNATDEIALKKISQIQPATIIIDDKVYAMELKTIEGVESYEDMQNTIYNTIQADYDSQFKSQQKIYEDKIARLKTLLEKEKNELFVDILKNAKEIFTDWSFEEVGGELFLRYKDRITVNKVVSGRRIFDYPGDNTCKEMYVSGLKVKVTPKVTDNDVIVSRGFNLHFNGTRGCIGNLSGEPLIKVLKELPRALKIANMNSPLNSDVRVYINGNFPPIRSDEEGTVRSGLGW